VATAPKAWDRKAPTLQQEIQKAIEEKDRAMALGGAIGARLAPERDGDRFLGRETC